MFRLARAGKNQPEAAFLDLGQQLVRALERLDLADELVELLCPRLAQGVPVRLLDLPTADRRDEQVPAHPDAAVDAPHGRVMSKRRSARNHARACW